MSSDISAITGEIESTTHISNCVILCHDCGDHVTDDYPHEDGDENMYCGFCWDSRQQGLE